MSARELAEAALELPEKDRLELARRIVASVAADRDCAAQIASAVQGIEDVVSGKVRGLDEVQFRDALK